MNSTDSESLVAFASAATHLRTNVTFAYSSLAVLSEIDVELDCDQGPVALFYTSLQSNPVLSLSRHVDAC